MGNLGIMHASRRGFTHPDSCRCQLELVDLHLQDELKKQGIHDDEEQRLLVANRVKPLAMEAAAAGGAAAAGASRWTPKQKLCLVGGLAALFFCLIVLVVAVRQPHPALAGFTGAGAGVWRGRQAGAASWHWRSSSAQCVEAAVTIRTPSPHLFFAVTEPEVGVVPEPKSERGKARKGDASATADAQAAQQQQQQQQQPEPPKTLEGANSGEQGNGELLTRAAGPRGRKNTQDFG